jgi:hypothetical protein
VHLAARVSRLILPDRAFVETVDAGALAVGFAGMSVSDGLRFIAAWACRVSGASDAARWTIEILCHDASGKGNKNV